MRVVVNAGLLVFGLAGLGCRPTNAVNSDSNLESSTSTAPEKVV